MADSTKYSRLRRTLLHPVWLGALVTLAINDHLLKGSDWLPGWFTGKLSDFVGLFAAPLLLAVLLRVRTRRGWLAAHVAIGVVFTAIQLSASFAALWSNAMGQIGFPWVITRDVTDLLALPMLAASFVLVPRWSARSSSTRASEVVVATGGLVCCVATSPPIGDAIFEPFDTDTYIHNDNSFDIVVRIRELRLDVQVNCDIVEESPGLYLSEALFGDALSWTLQPDATMPVLSEFRDSAADCHVALVDADNLPPSIVFWRRGEIATSFVQGLGITDDAPGWISISFDDEGRGRYANELDIVFPVEDPMPRPDGVCLPSADGSRLAWANAPAGIWQLADVDPGPDGCVQMKLRTGAQAESEQGGVSWTVCLPTGSFPFVDGDAIELTETAFTAGEEGLELHAVDPSSQARLEDGAALALARGRTIANLLGMQAVSTPEFNCTPVVDSTCGTVRQAASVAMAGGGFESTSVHGNEPTITRGGGQELELYLVHASERYVLDPECAGGAGELGADLEMVAVRRALGGE